MRSLNPAARVFLSDFGLMGCGRGSLIADAKCDEGSVGAEGRMGTADLNLDGKYRPLGPVARAQEDTPRVADSEKHPLPIGAHLDVGPMPEIEDVPACTG
jgi:hypothetical protein